VDLAAAPGKTVGRLTDPDRRPRSGCDAQVLLAAAKMAVTKFRAASEAAEQYAGIRTGEEH
jgi:hypothetical protein